MSRYIVQRVNKYTGEVLETEEEEFDTYDEAVDYATECSGEYGIGSEEWELLGRGIDDSDDMDYVVEEID